MIDWFELLDRIFNKFHVYVFVIEEYYTAAIKNGKRSLSKIEISFKLFIYNYNCCSSIVIAKTVQSN